LKHPCAEKSPPSAPLLVLATPKDRQVGNQEIQGNISMEPTWAGLSEHRVCLKNTKMHTLFQKYIYSHLNPISHIPMILAFIALFLASIAPGLMKTLAIVAGECHCVRRGGGP